MPLLQRELTNPEGVLSAPLIDNNKIDDDGESRDWMAGGGDSCVLGTRTRFRCARVSLGIRVLDSLLDVVAEGANSTLHLSHD